MLTIEELKERLESGILLHKKFLTEDSNTGDNCMFMKGKINAFDGVLSWLKDNKEEVADEV
jgi:hypothetical protein